MPKLTKAVVDRSSFDPKGAAWQVVWDSELVGFGLRLQPPSRKKPNGDRVYVVRYRNAEGKKRYLTLGRHGEVTTEQARRLAREKMASVWAGEDPQEKKRQAREEPDDDTFHALATAYVTQYAAAKRKSWRTDAARLLADPDDVQGADAKQARLEAPIRKLHHLRPGHDSREDFEDALRGVHEAIGQRAPVEADRVVQTVNAVLNWHAKRRRVPSSFMNIASLIELNGWQRREAHVRTGELAAFAAGASRLSLQWRAAAWLMLLTGSRSKSEVLSLRWENVHLHVGEFTYPMTKNGGAHTLPITPAVRTIFERLPRTSDWVFPARRDLSKPRQDSRKAFRKLNSDGAFVDRITPHALRHTARTYLEAKLRIPRSTVNAALNHADDGMAATYTHVNLDDVREALGELERFILSEAGIDSFDRYLQGPK